MEGPKFLPAAYLPLLTDLAWVRPICQMEPKSMKTTHATTRAWGWLVAGVLALGLNGFYQDGGAAWAHRIADRVVERSGALADLASEQVDRFREMADLVAVRDETTSCRLATAAARYRTEMART